MKPGDLLLVLLANTAWAFNFIVGKAGVSHFQPFLFTSLRFAVLLLVLLPFLRWLPGRMGGVLGIALVQGVIHFSLIFAGLEASGDIASVAIASQLYVPFSALLAVMFLDERLGRRRLLGMASAFGGVLVIGLDPLVFNHLDALLLITAGALAMAVATIQMRRLQGVGVLALQGWIALCATPALALLSLLFEDGQWAAVRSATPWVIPSSVNRWWVRRSWSGKSCPMRIRRRRLPVSLLLHIPSASVLRPICLRAWHMTRPRW